MYRLVGGADCFLSPRKESVRRVLLWLGLPTRCGETGGHFRGTLVPTKEACSVWSCWEAALESHLLGQECWVGQICRGALVC